MQEFETVLGVHIIVLPLSIPYWLLSKQGAEMTNYIQFDCQHDDFISKN